MLSRTSTEGERVGRSTADVEAIAAGRSYDLYLLTLDDIPFVQDGLRDGEHLRAWMTGRFRERLRTRAEPVVELSGTPAERLANAVAAVDAVLAQGWWFAEPLIAGSRAGASPCRSRPAASR